MQTRMMSHAEFHATICDPMEEITGREDEAQPGGVMDVVPYLRELGSESLDGLELIQDEPPAAVYRTGDRRFNHVLYKCNRSNVYAVLVVSMDPEEVVGHFVLDVSEAVSVDPS